MEEENQVITGQCYCGACKFELTGKPMMNVLCHCRTCSISMGVCPVHLMMMPDGQWKITEGEDKLNTFVGTGKLRTYKCKECGSGLCQGPEGMPFRAFYPRYMNGYVEGKINKLPENLMYKAHINYENRMWDFNDDVPKFAAFPPKNPVNIDGTPKTE